MSGRHIWTTTIGKTMRTCAVGAACALLGAVAAVAQEPAPQAAAPAPTGKIPPPSADARAPLGPGLEFTLFSVTGLSAETSANCRPERAPQEAPEVKTAEGRRAFAALFGGTDAVRVGSAMVALHNGRGVLDGVGLVNGRVVFFGLSDEIERGAAGRAELTLWEGDYLRPFLKEAFPLAPGRAVWQARRMSDERRSCVVVRMEALDVVPMGPPVDGATADSPRLTPPRLIKSVQPVYPEGARREGREGKAIVYGVIDAEGRLAFCRLLKYPPGGADMALAALDAASRWRWAPALLDGKPEPIPMTLLLTFTLTK